MRMRRGSRECAADTEERGGHRHCRGSRSGSRRAHRGAAALTISHRVSRGSPGITCCSERMIGARRFASRRTARRFCSWARRQRESRVGHRPDGAARGAGLYILCDRCRTGGYGALRKGGVARQPEPPAHASEIVKLLQGADKSGVVNLARAAGAGSPAVPQRAGAAAHQVTRCGWGVRTGR